MNSLVRALMFIYSVVMHQAVDLLGRHACLYLGSHQVECASGDIAAAADALNLLGSLDKVATGHEVATSLIVEDYLVHLGERAACRHFPIIFYLAGHIGGYDDRITSAAHSRPPWGYGRESIY